ncbi:MAG: hypothetical protein JJU30_07395 [Alkalimonas sp.]|nr:hypothetical protein [Alkalimonas sp.]
MFEYFNYQELKDYSAEETRHVLEGAKKRAYQAPSFWLYTVFNVIVAVGLGVFLMQLPNMMALERTVPGILIHGSSILIAVTLHHWLAKVHFKKYLLRQLHAKGDKP